MANGGKAGKVERRRHRSLDEIARELDRIEREFERLTGHRLGEQVPPGRRRGDGRRRGREERAAG